MSRRQFPSDMTREEHARAQIHFEFKLHVRLLRVRFEVV